MTSLRTLLTTVGLAGVLAACGSSPQPAQAPRPPAADAPTARAMKPPAAPSAPEPAGPDIPKYEIKGRRDPFETLEVKEGAAGTTVSSARLTGIVRSSHTTLALVETPEGIGYILRPGDTLGDGRLLEIGSDSVVFQVTPKLGSPTNRVVLKLAAN